MANVGANASLVPPDGAIRQTQRWDGVIKDRWTLLEEGCFQISSNARLIKIAWTNELGTLLVKPGRSRRCQDGVVLTLDLRNYVSFSRGGCKRPHFNSERKSYQKGSHIGMETISERKSYWNENHVGMEIISER